MVLIKNLFEEYAKAQGFSNGAELYEYITGDINAYKKSANEVSLCRASLKSLCWEIGFSEMTDFIRYEKNDAMRFRDVIESF